MKLNQCAAVRVSICEPTEAQPKGCCKASFLTGIQYYQNNHHINIHTAHTHTV